jgi:hypothetical protein
MYSYLFSLISFMIFNFFSLRSQKETKEKKKKKKIIGGGHRGGSLCELRRATRQEF